MLRDLCDSDLDSVHVLLSDWNVVRYMLLPLCATREESRQCMAEMLGDTPAWQSCVRAIVDAGSGELVGLCGIAVLRGSEQGELWYLVRPDRWGRGVGTQAARELLAVGFAAMGLHRLSAACLPSNPASARVLEKIGMRREGYQVRNLKIHGVWQDSFLYAMLREEWQPPAA